MILNQLEKCTVKVKIPMSLITITQPLLSKMIITNMRSHLSLNQFSQLVNQLNQLVNQLNQLVNQFNQLVSQNQWLQSPRLNQLPNQLSFLSQLNHLLTSQSSKKVLDQ